MSQRSRSRLVCGVASSVLLAAANGAQAQDADPAASRPAAEAAATVDEVLVTAQRRAQNLQDVGIAVSVVSGPALVERSITNTTQIAQFAPGVFISASSGGQDSQFTIRGVTQNDFNEVAESPVAVYVDDTYVPNLSGQTFALFDIQRVEVLKGPQGTLFGRNATGGLVQFLVNEPTSTPEGYANVSYGSFDQVRVQGAASGPLSGDLSGRLAVYYNRHDGYYENHYPQGLAAGPGGPNGAGFTPFGQDVGNDNTFGIRGQLAYAGAGGLKIRASASAARVRLSTGPLNEITLLGTMDAAGNLTSSRRGGTADAFGYVPLKGYNISSVFARRHGGNYVDAYDGGLHIDDDWGNVHVTSVSAYKYSRSGHEVAVAPSPTNLLNVEQPQKTTFISQELRFSQTADRLFWTGGAYFLYRRTANNFSFSIPPNSLLAGIYNSGTQGAFPSAFARFRDYSYSLFGQAEYALSPQVKLIAGVRGVVERQSYDFRSAAYLGEGNPYKPVFTHLITELSAPFSDDRTETLWTGKVQLEYRPVDDMLLYAGVNRGVKAGGYNLFPVLTPEVLDPGSFAYHPEVLLDYEGGLKASAGATTFNLSGYYYDYKDYQAFRFAGLSGTTVNNPATYYGAEAEVTLHPAPGLQLALQGSLVHARIRRVQITPAITRTVHPTFTPKRQVGAVLSYDLPGEVFGGRLNLGAEGHYNSSFYTDLRNFDGQRAPGYFVANVHLLWTDRADHVSAQLSVQNVGDKRYEITAFDFTSFCGCGEISYGQPRVVMVTLGYKF